MHVFCVNYGSVFISYSSSFLLYFQHSFYITLQLNSAGLTVPKLLVRCVEPQGTEASLEDMLDTILGAWALLHLLQMHHKQYTEDKPTGSPKIKKEKKELHSVIVLRGTNTSCLFSCPNFLLLLRPARSWALLFLSRNNQTQFRVKGSAA